jgi:Ca2+-binding RTX toxin-like protein
MVLALAFALSGSYAAVAQPPAAGAPETAAEQAASLPTPSCAEGPVREGDVIVGTDCADRIVVPPTVSYVDGGPGNDTIVGSVTSAASPAAASASCEAPVECHLLVGSQTFEGGPGNDIVYGDRGNDILRGNEGDDRLYGGIGDDRLEGGTGNDWLSGGFGADTIDGQEGSDYVRGDGTIDHIFDTGAFGEDTLSFASGVTPGFGAGIATGVSGFPGGAEGERGVYLHIGDGGEDAENGIAASGGGVDEVQPGAFETIIGTAFSDFIVGTSRGEEIFGGGGADVIEGKGGADALHGGADGDYLEVESGSGSIIDGEAGVDGCVGATASANCEGTTKAVHTRDTTKVSVGEVTAAVTVPGPASVDIYLVGASEGAATDDAVSASYAAGAVTFTLARGSFDIATTDAGGCTLGAGAEPTTATCPLGTGSLPEAPPLDAIVLAGMGGDDTIAASNFPAGTSVVELGGAGSDTLTGGPSEDVLVDGPPPEQNGAPTDTGADTLRGEAGDDALLRAGGADVLDGGLGSDLFLSVEVCEGATIAGGATAGSDRDNSSWARLGNGGVAADLLTGQVGRVGVGETVSCPTGTPDHLEGIEDLEGSEGSDVLIGDESPNQILGHRGEDTYRALGGDDSVFANSGTRDRVIDCGEGTDRAVIDLAAVGDPAPIGCESVREGAANEFQVEIEQPLPAPLTPPPAAPAPPPPPKTTKPKPDRTPPRTKVLGRPAAVIRVAPHRRATVRFRFAASERSRFECKLDAKPFRRCRSPLRAHLAIGRHAFRVFAIDAAGNRDKTPALVKVRVRVRHRPNRRRRLTRLAPPDNFRRESR